MKKIFATILALCMILTLCACGKGKTTSYSASGASYSTVAEEAAEDYYYAENSGLAPAMALDGDYSLSKSESGAETPQKQSDKIIYSASVTLETMSFDDTISGITELINSYGAYIESSSINGSNLDQINRGSSSRRSANYTIRVPAAKFDAMLNSISTLGNVPNKNVYSDNISSQYYDSEARLKNYQVQEQRLLELIDKATDISDIIALEEELSNVRYRIESIQSTLKGWDNQVGYSTVYLDVREVTKYVPSSQQSYMSKLGDAFSEGIEMLGDFVLGLISVFPILIFLAIIVIGIIHIVKLIRRNSLARKAGKAGKKKPAEKVGDEKVDERENI